MMGNDLLQINCLSRHADPVCRACRLFDTCCCLLSACYQPVLKSSHSRPKLLKYRAFPIARPASPPRKCRAACKMAPKQAKWAGRAVRSGLRRAPPSLKYLRRLGFSNLRRRKRRISATYSEAQWRFGGRREESGRFSANTEGLFSVRAKCRPRMRCRNASHHAPQLIDVVANRWIRRRRPQKTVSNGTVTLAGREPCSPAT